MMWNLARRQQYFLSLAERFGGEAYKLGVGEGEGERSPEARPLPRLPRAFGRAWAQFRDSALALAGEAIGGLGFGDLNGFRGEEKRVHKECTVNPASGDIRDEFPGIRVEHLNR